MKKYNYKVVGVTFAARDGSDRQTSLKESFDAELESGMLALGHSVKFEGYEYEGEDALAVFVDGKEVGNIAKDKVVEVAEIAQKASGCEVTLTINGMNIQDYDTIIDRYENAKDYQESDPSFDKDSAKEEYDNLKRALKKKTTYGAVLHFMVPEPCDIVQEPAAQIKEDSIAKPNQSSSSGSATNLPKKKPSKALSIIIVVLGIILVVGAILAIAGGGGGVFTIIMLALGVAIFVYGFNGSKKSK